MARERAAALGHRVHLETGSCGWPRICCVGGKTTTGDTMVAKFAFPSSVPQISKLPTEPFRREHAVMKLELEEIAERIGELGELHPAAQDAAMARVVAFFKHRIA